MPLFTCKFCTNLQSKKLTSSLIFTAKPFQETICNANQEKCVAEIKPNSSLCLTPCKGMYADVKKTPFIDNGFSFDSLHENYSHYKRFKEEEIKFPAELKGFQNVKHD